MSLMENVTGELLTLVDRLVILPTDLIVVAGRKDGVQRGSHRHTFRHSLVFPFLPLPIAPPGGVGGGYQQSALTRQECSPE